jgi:hypothetical protein
MAHEVLQICYTDESFLHTHKQLSLNKIQGSPFLSACDRDACHSCAGCERMWDQVEEGLHPS